MGFGLVPCAACIAVAASCLGWLSTAPLRRHCAHRCCTAAATPQGSFYQAECTSIDAERQVLTCAVDKCEVCKHEEEEPAAQVAAEGHAAARGWWPWARKGAVLSKAAPAAKPVGSSEERVTFEVPYDILLVGVSAGTWLLPLFLHRS